MPRCRVVTARLLLSAVAAASLQLGPGPVMAGASVATVIVVGDVHAGRPGSRDAETASVVESQPGLVIVAGDNAGRSGTYRDYRSLYARTWGRFRDRTRATPGNHDYYEPGAAGYFRYFGWRGGIPGACLPDVPRGRLAGRDARQRGVQAGPGLRPRLAGVHLAGGRPRAQPGTLHARRLAHAAIPSSGMHGEDERVGPLVWLLYRHGAETIVNGHDHDYERLAPARPDGKTARALGIRQFVVGTGGGELRGPGPVAAPHSEVFESSSWGSCACASTRTPTRGASWPSRGRRSRIPARLAATVRPGP